MGSLTLAAIAFAVVFVGGAIGLPFWVEYTPYAVQINKPSNPIEAGDPDH